MSYIGLLGGSFNPVHIGHIRLALEVLEYNELPMPIERVDLVPCAIPAHKQPNTLLPFEIRFAMLKATCENISGLYVNDIESKRIGKSYTWQTLAEYTKIIPDKRLLFIIGMENLIDLEKWQRGLELHHFADIAIVPRANKDKNIFQKKIIEYWPQALINNKKNPVAHLVNGEKNANIFYMPLPRIDISSTYIRKRWLAGYSTYALIPNEAQKILNQFKDKSKIYWNGKIK